MWWGNNSAWWRRHGHHREAHPNPIVMYMKKLASYMAFAKTKKAPSVAVKLSDMYDLHTMREALAPLQEQFHNVLPNGEINYPPWRTLDPRQKKQDRRFNLAWSKLNFEDAKYGRCARARPPQAVLEPRGLQRLLPSHRSRHCVV